MPKKSLHPYSIFVLSVVLLKAIPAAASGFEDGAVFTMDNATPTNHIYAFTRGKDGSLAPAGTFATDGSGTGTGLGNQGALALSRRGHWLLTVNAGSDEISVFRVNDNQLELTDKIGSGGKRPISVTLHSRLVYVLNAGGTAGSIDNITGFTLDHDGKLHPLSGSMRLLSAANTGPAEIQFSRDGSTLLVTEKATNKIDSFVVGDDGLVMSQKTISSAGETPFGFAFGPNNRVFVSEAKSDETNASSVSSYNVDEMGTLKVISATVPTSQTAACWLVVTDNGRFAYSANTPSSSISAFHINLGNGKIKLLDSRAGEPGDGSAPIDMALSRNSRYLYSLNAGRHAISTFKVRADGSLENRSGATDLPQGANGLVAW